MGLCTTSLPSVFGLTFLTCTVFSKIKKITTHSFPRGNVYSLGSSLANELVDQSDVSKCPTSHHSIVTTTRTIGVELTWSQPKKTKQIFSGELICRLQNNTSIELQKINHSMATRLHLKNDQPNAHTKA